MKSPPIFLVVLAAAGTLTAVFTKSFFFPSSPPPKALTQVEWAERLRDASVLVKAAGGMGTGVVIKNSAGETFIWTAAHVVDWNYDAKEPVTVSQDGVSVLADIVGYSSADNGEDLAVLKPRNAKPFTRAAKIFWGVETPPIGTKIFHVGCFFGSELERSFSDGIIAGLSRELSKDGLRDQSTAPAAPGSSGGGIFLAETGELIGILTNGHSDSITLFVPVRHMISWANASGHPEWLN